MPEFNTLIHIVSLTELNHRYDLAANLVGDATAALRGENSSETVQGGKEISECSYPEPG